MVLAAKSCDDIFNNLLQDGVSPDELYKTVFKQVCGFVPHFWLICIV